MQAGAHALAHTKAFADAVAGPFDPAQPAGDTYSEPLAERNRRTRRHALDASLRS